MKDLTKKYMDELKGAKNYDFLEALVESANKNGWIENRDLVELLSFAMDLNKVALAYIKAKENNTKVMEEMKIGLYSMRFREELVEMFEEIANKGE